MKNSSVEIAILSYSVPDVLEGLNLTSSFIFIAAGLKLKTEEVILRVDLTVESLK